MSWLRQSTVTTVQIGPELDSTDGNTTEEALTITQADVRLSKHGGTFAQATDANAAVHDENGWYRKQLDATDTGTLGRLLVAVHEGGALAAWREFMVITAQAWDSLFSTDKLQVHVAEMTAGIITAAAIATDAIGSDELATTAREEIADQVWDEVLTGATHNVSTSAGRRLRQLEDVTLLSEGTAQAGANGSITLAAGESASDDWYNHAMIILTSGTGSGQARSIQTYTGDTKVATIIPDWVTNPAADTKYSILAFAEVHVNELHTASITAGSFAAGAIDAAAIATDAVNEIVDQVWDEALADHDVEDSIGNVINDLVEESGGTYRLTAAALQSTLGSGAITFTYTLTSSVDAAAIPDATIWVTTDEAGTLVIASGTTNTSGQVIFYLDAGTYYVWRHKSGWNFTNPDIETVA